MNFFRSMLSEGDIVSHKRWISVTVAATICFYHYLDGSKVQRSFSGCIAFSNDIRTGNEWCGNLTTDCWAIKGHSIWNDH